MFLSFLKFDLGKIEKVFLLLAYYLSESRLFIHISKEIISHKLIMKQTSPWIIKLA